MRTDTLIHFHHSFIKQFWQFNLAHKKLGTGLISNAKLVTKTARDHEQCAFAFALKQRIGGNRGAHLNRFNLIRWNRIVRLEPKQVANPLHRRIFVTLRVLGQQLVRDERSVGFLSDDVSERAAAIDPELPLRARFNVCCVHLLVVMK